MSKSRETKDLLSLVHCLIHANNAHQVLMKKLEIILLSALRDLLKITEATVYTPHLSIVASLILESKTRIVLIFTSLKAAQKFANRRFKSGIILSAETGEPIRRENTESANTDSYYYEIVMTIRINPIP